MISDSDSQWPPKAYELFNYDPPNALQIVQVAAQGKKECVALWATNKLATKVRDTASAKGGDHIWLVS